jgi:hypothetical protein
MTDTKRQPAAQVAMAHKAAETREKNKARIKQQRPRPPAPTVRPRAPRLQDNSRTEASEEEGEVEVEDGEPDSFVPDAVVAKELGTSVMGLWRRTNDPDDNFPAPIKVNGRNYRSRRALESYKARKLREAMREHHKRLNIRRRVPLPMPEELEPSK